MSPHDINNGYRYVCNTEETYLQDFLEILKHLLQNFKKILRILVVIVHHKHMTVCHKNHTHANGFNDKTNLIIQRTPTEEISE